MDVSLHINWTRYSKTHCAVIDCPVCQRPRRMLCRFQDWYGTTVTCTGCGDQWTDGERHDRPFYPGWRKDHIRYAREVLATIGIQA